MPISPTLALYLSAALQIQQPEDMSSALLIQGGTLITNDSEQPIAEALLVQDGIVLKVGDLGQVMALPEASRARRLDLKGAVLYPGFADGHAHLVSIGLYLNRVNLVGTRSMPGALDRVKEFMDERMISPGEWVHGRGWDQNDWAVQDFPTHQLLSRAFPDNPVLLRRIDGHALLANQAAMSAAGITAQTPDPVGGRILHDADGNPTGVFIDAASSLVSSHAPPISEAELERAVRLSAQALHSRGITAIHDAGASIRQIEMYQKLAASGELGLRVHVMVSASEKTELTYWLKRGPLVDPSGQVNVRAIKVYADGALGSRGAALLEEYADDPGNFGLLLTEAERIQQVALQGLNAGFQVCTHAIGDRANRLALDAYEAAFEKFEKNASQPSRLADARFRVEHAQVVSAADLPRFGALGVLPAMQPQHQSSDMPWAEERVGSERIRGAYAWKSMLDGGAIVIGGSDAPIEQLDPVGAFLSAITRQDIHGKPESGWYPEQCMTRQQGLLQMTAWPAYGAFQEESLGALKPGMRADFTVLDKNLLSDPIKDLREAKVLLTIFDGKIVFQAGE
jgi:predicted amidohydrolase YtcJ